MLIALLAVAAVGSASPQQTQAWRSCVLAATAKWARNNETADVIAEGAMGACQAQEPARSGDSDDLRRQVKQAAIAVVLDRRKP
jgi:hypothetical protein